MLSLVCRGTSRFFSTILVLLLFLSVCSFLNMLFDTYSVLFVRYCAFTTCKELPVLLFFVVFIPLEYVWFRIGRRVALNYGESVICLQGRVHTGIIILIDMGDVQGESVWEVCRVYNIFCTDMSVQKSTQKNNTGTLNYFNQILEIKLNR